MTAGGKESIGSRTFRGWVWEPNRKSGQRGVAPANIVIEGGRVSVAFRWGDHRFVAPLEARDVEYTWPTTVVEHFKPNTGYLALLIDVHGDLGSIVVRGRHRLADALSEAGFHVIEGSRWLWDEPRPVPASFLGDRVDEVPKCVVT